MNSLSDDDATRRKRLLWRASHRGIKEMDLILGGFVARHLESFAPAELDELEAIITLPDQEMLAWATKQADVPAEHASSLLLRMLDFRP
jgi:antitoxin CptB